MNPIVAVILGWALLGEEMTLQMVVAGAAIVVSVALILRASGAALEPGRGIRRRRCPALRSTFRSPAASRAATPDRSIG